MRTWGDDMGMVGGSGSVRKKVAFVDKVQKSGWACWGNPAILAPVKQEVIEVVDSHTGASPPVSLPMGDPRLAPVLCPSVSRGSVATSITSGHG